MKKKINIAIVSVAAALGIGIVAIAASDAGEDTVEVQYNEDHPQYAANVEAVREHLIKDYGIMETAELCEGLQTDQAKDIYLQLLTDSGADYSNYGDSLDLAYKATVHAAKDICNQ